MSKKKKIAIIIATIILAPIALIVFIFGWEGSTADIRKVADQFQPPADWQLEDELVRPPKIMCLDGGTCPELQRNWRTNGISKEAINKVLATTGWGFEMNEGCHLGRAHGPSIPVCHTQGAVKNYDVSVYVSGNSEDPTHFRLALNIRPR